MEYVEVTRKELGELRTQLEEVLLTWQEATKCYDPIDVFLEWIDVSTFESGIKHRPMVVLRHEREVS